MNTTLPKSPDKDDTAEMPVVARITPNAFATIYVKAGKLEAGLRKRTLLDERCFRQLLRQAAVPGHLDELAKELGYSSALIDDELTQFLYHSSQVSKAVGVEYADYTDDWEAIKRKFAAYIATPGIDDLWAEMNRAINSLERNPDPITAPGVVSSDPK